MSLVGFLLIRFNFQGLSLNFFPAPSCSFFFAYHIIRWHTWLQPKGGSATQAKAEDVTGSDHLAFLSLSLSLNLKYEGQKFLKMPHTSHMDICMCGRWALASGVSEPWGAEFFSFVSLFRKVGWVSGSVSSYDISPLYPGPRRIKTSMRAPFILPSKSKLHTG